MMLTLIQVFLQIALRRLGPEDLPDSTVLLAVSGAAYALAQGAVIYPVLGAGLPLLTTLGLDVLLLCVCLGALLRATGHAGRYVRTLTALFGTGALLTVFILPFNLWISASGTPSQPPVVAVLGVLGIIIWSQVVNGHILARALGTGFAAGLGVALGYFLLNYYVITRIGTFPA